MNKLTIIGNLTRDPELRTTSTGINVCDFTVAVNKRQSAEQKQQGVQPEADFFRVSAWRALGENCQKFLAKGRKVAVVGSVSVRTYTGNDGVTRANLEVNADDVEFLSPNPNNQNGGYQNQQYQPAPAPQYAPPAPPGTQYAQYPQGYAPPAQYAPQPGYAYPQAAPAPAPAPVPQPVQTQMPIAGAPAAAVPNGFTAVETDDLPF